MNRKAATTATEIRALLAEYQRINDLDLANTKSGKARQLEIAAAFEQPTLRQMDQVARTLTSSGSTPHIHDIVGYLNQA